MKPEDLKALRDKIRQSRDKKELERLSREKSEKANLPRIRVIKKSIEELAEKYLQPAFEESGEVLVVRESDPDTSKGKEENFIEILFYPRDSSREIRGVNTAALRFIFDSKSGKIRVLRRKSYFPIPLKEDEEQIEIDNNSEEVLSDKAIKFATEVANQ
jgi:hypothetical protein